MLLCIPRGVAVAQRKTIIKDLDVDSEHSFGRATSADNYCRVRAVPCGRRQDGLEFRNPSVDGNKELDVVEGHRRRHGLSVVFVVYSQVSAAGLTPPAHG